jgi:hypothetical protein
MDELLNDLNAAGIRYVVMGGQAMRLLGMPRYSMDWDLFIPPRDDENFAKLNALLEADLDEPLVPLGSRGENFIQTYQTCWGVLQFHLGVPGLPNFDAAEGRAVVRLNENGIPVKCLCGSDLLAAKKAADRPQDQADIEFLMELQRLGKLL